MRLITRLPWGIFTSKRQGFQIQYLTDYISAR